MLRSMRDGAKSGFLKFILLGFMALAVGGLVLTDVGGFFRGGVSNNVVAKGKGIEITIQEFDRNLRRILAQQGIGAEEAYASGIIERVLRGEVQNRILTKEAMKLGINPNDETVAKQISIMAAPLARDGVSKRDALRQTLRAQGISEAEFVEAVRQEMGNNMLQMAIVSGASFLPAAQAKALYQYENETRSFNGLFLSHDSVRDITQPTDEQLQSYYNARKVSFAIPETRDITIATLKQDMLKDKINLSDEKLQSFYDKNIDTFKQPERRKLDQAVLPSQKEALDVVENAKTQSIQRAAIKAMKSDNHYLGENDFAETSLIKDLATPVFDAAEGDIVGPIQSPLGWHVIKVKKVMPAQTQKLADVKDDIRKIILDQELADELVDTANTIDDQLAGGEDFDVVVKEFGLTTETIESLKLTGQTDDGKTPLKIYEGDKARILEVAFDYDAEEVTPIMEMADGRYIAIQINDVTPLSYTPFETVKKKLQGQWVEEQQRLANISRADDAAMAIKANEKTLNDLGNDYDLSMLKFNELERANTPPTPLDLLSLRQIFDADKGNVIKVETANGVLIGNVANISLPATDTKEAEEAIATIQKNYAQYLPQEYLEQYIMAKAKEYNVTLNDRALRQFYGPEAAQN